MSLTKEEIRRIDEQQERDYQRSQAGAGVRMPDDDTFQLAMQSLDDAFPEGIDPHFEPFGDRVLVQMRRAQTKTKGGIELVETTQSDIKYNQQVAKVVALGPLCFRNRETAELWPEGMWASVGDFVRVPRWNGDRIVVSDPNGGADITFVTFKDYEIFGRVTGDPLAMRVYIV